MTRFIIGITIAAGIAFFLMSFIDYAMSVITDRALPDIRDGLKPVQRRILYSMFSQGFTPDKPYRKCATTVGDVLGRFHPHGDASVYDALVRLAQDFSLRHPLVDGHGNFGSIDGDPPAAYRYTEARLEKVALEMMSDINKNTVEMRPNFDEHEMEPVTLPARFISNNQICCETAAYLIVVTLYFFVMYPFAFSISAHSTAPPAAPRNVL